MTNSQTPDPAPEPDPEPEPEPEPITGLEENASTPVLKARKILLPNGQLRIILPNGKLITVQGQETL